MPGTKDPREPNQWQQGQPGWRFDGWGVARGGHDWEPTIYLRPGPVERAIGKVGWSLFAILLISAIATNLNALGVAALAVAATTIISRKIVNRWRTKRGAD